MYHVTVMKQEEISNKPDGWNMRSVEPVFWDELLISVRRTFRYVIIKFVLSYWVFYRKNLCCSVFLRQNFEINEYNTLLGIYSIYEKVHIHPKTFSKFCRFNQRTYFRVFTDVWPIYKEILRSLVNWSIKIRFCC